jgi:hypothetical protein
MAESAQPALPAADFTQSFHDDDAAAAMIEEPEPGQVGRRPDI